MESRPRNVGGLWGSAYRLAEAPRRGGAVSMQLETTVVGVLNI